VPYFHLESQSPSRVQALTARVFHLKRCAVATAVFDFNDCPRIEALATLVFHFDNHAFDQALAPGVLHPSCRDFAPVFILPCDLDPWQALAL
jgi:hypothetical protein